MADAVKIAGEVDGAVDAAVEGVAQAAQVDPGKPFYKSKTFWANVGLFAAHYGGLVSGPAALPVAIGTNLVLRYLTNRPIAPILQTLAGGVK